MKMFAENKGDRWIINGTKRYISNGGLAKLYLMVVRTDRDGPLASSLTAFLVPADAKGFSVPEVWDKLGQVRTSCLFYREANVKGANWLLARVCADEDRVQYNARMRMRRMRIIAHFRRSRFLRPTPK